MTWKWTSGVQDVSSQRCWRASRCSQARTTSISSPSSPSYWEHHRTTLSRLLVVRMYGLAEDRGCGLGADWQLQTLRFVQSLPKRERQPLTNKFKNADPLGETVLPLVTDRANHSQQSTFSRRCSSLTPGYGSEQVTPLPMSILRLTTTRATNQWRRRSLTGRSTMRTYR